MNDVKIYRIKKSNMFVGAFILTLVFFGLTLPALINSESITLQQLIGQVIFWCFGLFLTVTPLMASFEVGSNYTKSYLFGMCIDSLKASDMKIIKYGKIKRWGLVGMGNGLMGWVKTKHGRRYFSFSESGYGKEAIMDAKRALESN